MAGALNRRLGKMTSKAAEFRGRIEEGAAAEDETKDDETKDDETKDDETGHRAAR
jgi:hypothetical protein